MSQTLTAPVTLVPAASARLGRALNLAVFALPIAMAVGAFVGAPRLPAAPVVASPPASSELPVAAR